MAETLYSQSGKIEYGIKKYVVDTEADKEALNLRATKMGSKCYVMDTKKWYILNSSNEWVPFVGEGASGRSPFNIKGSVATVNDLPTEDNAIGDLYIVQEDHSEWVWLTSDEEPNGYWEQLGMDILPETIVAVTEQMDNTQKAQMLNNIGSEPKKLVITVTESGGVYSADKTQMEITTAYDNGKVPIVRFGDDIYGLANTDSVDFFFSVCSGSKIKQISLTPTGNVDVWSYAEIAVQPALVTISSTDPTFTPIADTVYNCGELSSLTVSSSPASGAYSIVFTSGSTATTTTIPATILGLESFAPEANTIYEINVLDNRAVVGSWAVSA